MARPMATSIGGLCRLPQVFEILFWPHQVLLAQGGGLLRKLGDVRPCEWCAPPHGLVWAPHHPCGGLLGIFQAKLLHPLAQKREWAEFFQAQLQAKQQGGGSNRDLVLLFAFVGEMPGFPFSCAAAVKGVFSLSQRFGQVAP